MKSIHSETVALIEMEKIVTSTPDEVRCLLISIHSQNKFLT